VPGLRSSRSELLAAGVPLSRARRRWSGDRAQQLNGFALYCQHACSQWRSAACTSAGSLVVVSNEAERVVHSKRGLRKRTRRTVKSKVSQAKPSWKAWRAAWSSALQTWRSNAALREMWRARVPAAVAARVAATEAACCPTVQDLPVEQTLWEAGNSDTPLRLEVLDARVATDAIAGPAAHPYAGSVVGPTRFARRLVPQQDAASIVADPLPRGGLGKLVCRQPCWQRHPGLCRSVGEAVYTAVLLAQANINTICQGRLWASSDNEFLDLFIALSLSSRSVRMKL
jgi:hypothetical protein